MVEEAAVELGLSTRQTYHLLKSFRQTLSTSALIPANSSVGRRKSRITMAQEQLLAEVLSTFYCNKQRPSVAATFREIRSSVQRRRGEGDPELTQEKSEVLQVPILTITRNGDGTRPTA